MEFVEWDRKKRDGYQQQPGTRFITRALNTEM